jgi:hypothetical protein
MGEKDKGVIVASGLSTADFNKGLGSSVKLAIVNVVDRLLGKHGVAEIRSPQSYALVYLNSDFIGGSAETNDGLFPAAANIDRAMMRYAEEFSTGKSRAKDIMEVCKVEIQKDFEIEKEKVGKLR